jgi:LysR family glycine cleavage system transcriptional activator
MAGADLEAGRLIGLSPVSARLGHPYCAFMPSAKADRADVAALVGLLVKTAPST